MKVIQSVTVVTRDGLKTYEVGREVRGQVIIEIKSVGLEYEDHVHSEYHALDEKGEVILAIENCPVIVEWQEVVEG